MSGSPFDSPRLHLRPARRDDVPVLYEWYRDPTLMSLYDGVPFPTESLGVFERQYSLWLDHDVVMGLAGSFLMELRDGGPPIGECSWTLVDRTGPPSPGIYQVGGLVGPAALRGKGYGTEALRLLRDHLFRELNAHRLEAITSAFNSAAMKTLHRNGFVREGVLREAVRLGDAWQDRVMFSLLRREWESGARPAHEFPHD